MPNNSQALTDNQKLAADIREAMVILARVIRKFWGRALATYGAFAART